MSVQRFMAARSLRAAKRTTVAGSHFILFFFLMAVFAGVAIIYWYRDCDPLVKGVIKSYDQIVPYYMTQSLSEVSMLRGLFLAGVLGASTSTVSSVVNSNAATFYVDVLTPYVKMSERKAVLVMRLLAFASGAIMTMLAVAAPAAGTVARAFVSLYASASGPFAGLVLLAISSPWVNAKGAGWACVLVCGLQVWHAVGRSLSHVAIPPLLTGTLERCPLALNTTQNFTNPESSVQGSHSSSSYVFPLYQLSFLWISSIGALLTIFLGTTLSLATGGVAQSRKNLRLTSLFVLSFWLRFKFFRRILQCDDERNWNITKASFKQEDQDVDQSHATALSSNPEFKGLLKNRTREKLESVT
ncbi:hypothetical protein V5799_003017 [Amblyomma americanum]|uniref:Sodium-dependent multivitamin transporter n=1 Tax=Amblyomma americanum TaxID=6943 RepID=A0AAQ4DA59_AMBAM